MNSFCEKIISILMFILCFPLMVAIGGLIKITSRGPILYCSVRIGINNQPIRIWKFRTMDAEVALEIMAKIFEHEEWRSNYKLMQDPRITPLGKLLRRFSLDELPQLWNVIIGDMALIGPRPISRQENRRYGKHRLLIHSVKPGITGLWQVSGRNLTTYRRRIAINIYYVKHKSLSLDLWILWKTVYAVISGYGAF